MLFCNNLLLSEKLKNHLDILKNIRDGALPENVFIICINKASRNLMDIYFTGEICKPYVKIDDLLIIAICQNKNDAKEKSAEILSDFLKENGSLDGFKDKFCVGDSK